MLTLARPVREELCGDGQYAAYPLSHTTNPTAHPQRHLSRGLPLQRAPLKQRNGVPEDGQPRFAGIQQDSVCLCPA